MKKKRQELFQTRNLHHCANYAVKSTIEEIFLTEITFVMSVEGKGLKKRKVM